MQRIDVAVQVPLIVADWRTADDINYSQAALSAMEAP